MPHIFISHSLLGNCGASQKRKKKEKKGEKRKKGGRGRGKEGLAETRGKTFFPVAAATGREEEKRKRNIPGAAPIQVPRAGKGRGRGEGKGKEGRGRIRGAQVDFYILRLPLTLVGGKGKKKARKTSQSKNITKKKREKRCVTTIHSMHSRGPSARPSVEKKGKERRKEKGERKKGGPHMVSFMSMRRPYEVLHPSVHHSAPLRAR